MSRIVRYAYCASLVLLLTATMSGLVFAEEEKEVRIHVKKMIVECEDGEDCARHVVIQHLDGDDDGEHAFRWIHGDGHRLAFATAHPGKGGHLGVPRTDLTHELRTHFGVPDGVGVMVSKVLEDSPAMDAGIEVGDIITMVNGDDIAHAGELAKTIRASESGETVLLEVWRDGRIQQITVTVTESEGPLRAAHRIRKIIRCSDGEDCDFDLSGFDFDFDFDFGFGCEDGETCAVMINCEDDGDCECSANGESIDCPDLPHLDSLRSLHEQH